MIPICAVDSQSVAAGAALTVLRLAPRDRRLTLRTRHLYLHTGSGVSPPTVLGRLRCSIPGLSDLDGLPLFSVGTTTGGTMIVPVFYDLDGDARGDLSVENASAGALTMTAGLDGYYLEDEAEEIALRPGLESPSFVRSSGTVVATTSDTELLNFRTPDYRGGVVLSGFWLAMDGIFNRCTITFEGNGLQNLGPLTIQAPRMFPIAALIPPLTNVRVLLRRSAASGNVALSLFGYGLP